MSETNLAVSSSVENSAENQRVITYAQAGVEGVREEMRRNPNIFYIGQGIGPRGGNFQQSRGLWDEFGEERVRDTPIAERGQTGLGIGAALAGSHPIVDIVFLDFTLEAMEKSSSRPQPSITFRTAGLKYLLCCARPAAVFAVLAPTIPTPFGLFLRISQA